MILAAFGKGSSEKTVSRVRSSTGSSVIVMPDICIAEGIIRLLCGHYERNGMPAFAAGE